MPLFRRKITLKNEDIGTTLGILFSEWNWLSLGRRKYVDNLIWTGYGTFRKDNKTVQNVGKPMIKFKFEVGSYYGGRPTKTPRHFSISTTGRGDRICWMALQEGDVYIKQRKSHIWGEPINLTDFFDSPAQPTKDELEFLEFLMPDSTMQIAELLPGLLGVDAALKERFTGLQ